MRYILAVSLYFCLLKAQFPPQWGSIECDSSLSDRFRPGTDTFSYTYYDRYYTLTTEYPTEIRRDVKISTCIEETPYTMSAQFETNAWSRAFLRPIANPTSTTSYESYTSDSCDSDSEQGRTYKFHNVPAGEYEIGIYSNNADGGKYKLTVECIEPVTPAPNLLKSNNVTTRFPYYSEWRIGGYKEISCGVSAFDTLPSAPTWGSLSRKWYQYTVTDYAQEIVFTTCTPETAFDSPGDLYDGSNIGNHQLYFGYWDYGTWGNRQWRWDTENNWGGSTCETLEIGDAYDTDILRLSPGEYWIAVERFSTAATDSFVLSMLCWNNDAVTEATAGENYKEATFNPTASPVTLSPTTPAPTANTTTLSPTTYPTVLFAGPYDNTKRTVKKGSIACGMHQHDTLGLKYSHYYTFEVLVSNTQVYFDTCMNDLTNFDSCTHVHRYNTGNNEWTEVDESCGYCNILSLSLSANLYYVEIFGDDKFDDSGEYILRMGCGYGESSQVTPVDLTDAPTPQPTGIEAISAKDGRIAGDISCGLTVSGKTKSRTGDFHKFTVVGGGIDWVKFDTCEATSFENYLFVYDRFNLTGHEYFDYGSWNSIGFHYEDGTTCNEMTMNELVPGVYYVNIDGYNYYFDHGEYTITMSCSDSSSIKGASNYTEYKEPLAWWIILLIVVGVLACCGGILFVFCYMKRKKDAGDDGVSGVSTEMQNTGDGEFRE